MRALTANSGNPALSVRRTGGAQAVGPGCGVEHRNHLRDGVPPRPEGPACNLPRCQRRQGCRPAAAAVRQPPLSRTRKRRQEPPTRLLTPPTHLGGNAAMFMVLSMQLALLGARNARGKTALDGSPRHRQVNSCTTRQDRRRGGAHVRTVEVCPYALDQRDDVRLRHAGIGARSAGLEAGDAFFDALDQFVIEGRRISAEATGTRVGVGHLSDN